jgi:hypothetical protein
MSETSFCIHSNFTNSQMNGTNTIDERLIRPKNSEFSTKMGKTQIKFIAITIKKSDTGM